jgi:hypothetical protein
MILNKRNAQTARWDHSNNKWSVGTVEYQWVDMKNKPISVWMSFDDALVWIKEYDNRNSNQNTEILLER